MRTAVLGTGVVGRTIAGKLAELGNEVMVGTRDPEAVMERTEPDPRGGAPFSAWLGEHDAVQVASFADAAAAGEIVFNATAGVASIAALEAAGSANLDGKILIDIANPLDFSGGAPRLSVANTDSLGEQIQRAFPGAKVVKALNTVTASVMIEPGALPGDHVLFLCGDHDEAKDQVTTILQEWFGWKEIIDLGGIDGSRAMEMYLMLWIRLFGSYGDPMFNIALRRAT